MQTAVLECMDAMFNPLLKSLITKPMHFTLNAFIENHHQHLRLFTTNYGFKDSLKILSTDL